MVPGKEPAKIATAQDRASIHPVAGHSAEVHTVSQNFALAALAEWIGGAAQNDPQPEPGVRRYVGSPVPTLGTVYTGFPARMPAEAFYAGVPDGSAHGATAVIRAEEPRETRVGVGPHGLRRILHQLTVHVYHRSEAHHAEDARANLRDVQDQLAALLRTDPTLGGQVFSAGEAGVSDTANGTGHVWRTGNTASAGGRHETRSDWDLAIVEYVQP
jgi:hypothetical protein